MENKLSYKMLDDFLALILESDDGTLEINETSEYNNLKDISYEDQKSIITKLAEEGMINAKLEETDEECAFLISSLTFEGKLLLQDGGYQNKIKKEHIEAKLKAVQTWAIAIGTFLAAVFSILSYFNIR